LLGSEEAVAVIDGSMLRDERRKVEERFRQDKGVRILIATDAAGEGLNLQRAHLMVNYDLPWNPNRLEQRFGRIHRIGQTKPCWLWNLVAAETREGKVFKRLFEKLEQEREALGGKVFDILGKVTFRDRPLRELLIEAVRHGSDPAVESRLNEDLDDAFSREAIRRLLQEHALTQDVMDAGAVAAIRENMERMEARRLQPYFIEAFFKDAFRKLGGRMAPREKGRWEVTFVPHILRSRGALINSAELVLKSYERICFEKRLRELPGAVPASLICPSHPLLDTVIDILRERSGNILKRGAVLVDENALSPSPRLLLFIEHAIQDGNPAPGGGRRIISRRIHFVEIECSGAAKNAGFAPYLDYRPATEEEAETARTLAADHGWLNEKAKALALNHAVLHLIPAHLEEVRSRKKALVEKTRKAVKERLTAEIQYWDYRAADLKQREQAGKKNAALNSQRAERRAEELEQRLKRRMEELEAEENISALPPVVIGAALIVPASHACAPGSPFCQEADTRKKVEEAAMRAVMEAERAQGFTPRDVSAENCGYDIESSVPCAMEKGLPSLRFIEVKGRIAGASNVIVTRNEILTALNMPEQFILALVEVNGEHTRTTYLKRPFKNRPDFSSEAGIFNLSALMEQAEIIYQGESHGTV
ncbi:MAG: helicase-related protein, partial [Mailhella sp.]